MSIISIKVQVWILANLSKIWLDSICGMFVRFDKGCFWFSSMGFWLNNNRDRFGNRRKNSCIRVAFLDVVAWSYQARNGFGKEIGPSVMFEWLGLSKLGDRWAP